MAGPAAERAAAERDDEVTDAYYVVNDESDTDYSHIHDGYWISLDGTRVVQLEEQFVAIGEPDNLDLRTTDETRSDGGCSCRLEP